MRATNAASSLLTPVITAGYNEDRYPSPRVTPPGQYVGVYPHTVPPPDPPPVLPKPMEGACAYWDGQWDYDYAGNATSGTNVDVEIYGENYRAYLAIDGEMLTGVGEWVAFTKEQ